MYSCTMPVPDPGGGAEGACAPPPPPPPLEEAVSVLKKICFTHFMYGNGLVEVWHDGYANRANSLTSLPRAKDCPTDSRTVLHRAVD